VNCPRCGVLNADGKNFCGDCGTPLDATSRYLEEFIRVQVEDTIQHRLKNQELLEIETAARIATKLHGWATVFTYFVGIPLAIFLIVLGILGFREYRDFTALIRTADTKIRPLIDQATMSAKNAQTEAAAAQKRADEAQAQIANTMEQLKLQLRSATGTTQKVSELSHRVSDLEQQTTNRISGASKRVDARIADLDVKMDAALKDIGTQQSKLASTSDLVSALFSKGETQLFSTAGNSSEYTVVPGTGITWVFFLLKQPPIFQTVQLQWHVYVQPKSSLAFAANVMVFRWGDPVENLKQYPFEVSYVPDPTYKGPVVRALSVRNGDVYGDDKLLSGPWNKTR
jgi:F0F1-type ATP synthase membrane subunit b/b'